MAMVTEIMGTEYSKVNFETHFMIFSANDYPLTSIKMKGTSTADEMTFKLNVIIFAHCEVVSDTCVSLVTCKIHVSLIILQSLAVDVT